MNSGQVLTGKPSGEFLAWLIAEAINAEARGDSGLARVWWDTLARLSGPEQPEDDTHEVHGK